MADEKVICIFEDPDGRTHWLIYADLAGIQSALGVGVNLIELNTNTGTQIYYAKTKPVSTSERIEIIYETIVTTPIIDNLSPGKDKKQIKAFQIKSDNVDYSDIIERINQIMKDLTGVSQTFGPTIAGKLADIIIKGPKNFMKKGGKKRYRSYHKPSTSHRRSKKRATRGRKNKRQSRRRA
jgi:hypothetical protein